MLTELYIEALLIDEVLADQVWELSEAGLISDEVADLDVTPLGVLSITVRSKPETQGRN